MNSYSEENNKSKYQLLLEREEWIEKRNSIVTRDKLYCQRCDNESYLLNTKLKIRRINKTWADKSRNNYIKLSSFNKSEEEEIVRLTKEPLRITKGYILFALINSDNQVVSLLELTLNAITNRLQEELAKVFLKELVNKAETSSELKDTFKME